MPDRTMLLYSSLSRSPSRKHSFVLFSQESNYPSMQASFEFSAERKGGWKCAHVPKSVCVSNYHPTTRSKRREKKEQYPEPERFSSPLVSASPWPRAKSPFPCNAEYARVLLRNTPLYPLPCHCTCGRRSGSAFLGRGKFCVIQSRMLRGNWRFVPMGLLTAREMESRPQ